MNLKKMKLGVSIDNNVSEFWKKFGFSETGKVYEWQGEHKTTQVQEFEKNI